YITVCVVLLDSTVASNKTQYMFVEVVVDSKNCTNNANRWQLQQEIVFEILQKHTELGLSMSGRYCGCKISNQTRCTTGGIKSVEMLMYDSETGSISAKVSTVSSLEKELHNLTTDMINPTIPPFYICSNLEIVTDTDTKYTACIANSTGLFNNTVSQASKSEADSGPSIGTIVGAAVGAFAALGLIAASAWYVLRHLKNNHIEN
ncbi:uncharacterized protein LOC132755282, partial [Ruditapes philippinarum]|uniref:uncharacterized protein LOC132755282 n=1 Tax=Ruditapes philippinarum TaxID=129788 RepID=UPI00295A857D